ncbi:hypothetical protein FQN60_007900, partial [Etheostoma spectabile]
PQVPCLWAQTNGRWTVVDHPEGPGQERVVPHGYRIPSVPSCLKKVAGWLQDMLEQLDIAHREQFPAVLTYKYV